MINTKKTAFIDVRLGPCTSHFETTVQADHLLATGLQIWYRGLLRRSVSKTASIWKSRNIYLFIQFKEIEPFICTELSI